jgi:predicted RNA methylase
VHILEGLNDIGTDRGEVTVRMDVKNYWSATEGVFNCLIDEERTKAFESAIKKTVRRGDVVVDMGSGSGVLAMFAAQAGARRVYAVEGDERNIEHLQATLVANGFEDRIAILAGDVTTIDLPESVDVIVGEMVATGLIEELQIPASNNMLRFRNPSTRVLLRAIENHADLVQRREEFYGLRFPIIGYQYPGDAVLEATAVTTSFMYKRVEFDTSISDSTIDASFVLTAPPPPPPQPEEAGARDRAINALRIRSISEFWDGSRFGASFAYCYPILLPIKPMAVAPGSRYRVSLQYRMCEGFGTLRYGVEPSQ